MPYMGAIIISNNETLNHFTGSRKIKKCKYDEIITNLNAALAQMVAYLSLVQQGRGSIPGGVVNFHLKIFYLGARRGGDVP